MWMARGSSPSSRSERKTSKLWWPSAISAWDCLRSRRTRSSRRSSPPSLTARVWDSPSAARSLSHMAAACGLPTTLRAAPVFVSPYPPKSRQRNEPADAPTVLGMLHKQMTSELGTSEITVKIHREDGSEFYGSVSGAPLRDGMGRLLDLILFTLE